MHSNPIVRALRLMKLRYRLIAIAVSASVLGSLLLSLTRPYVYRSEVIVQVQPPSNASDYDNYLLYKVARIFKSATVLNKVAEDMGGGPGDRTLLFPNSLSRLDFGSRFHVLWARLGFGPKLANSPRLAEGFSREIFATLLDQHITVEPDPISNSIKMTYEGGSGTVAQWIATLIVNRFVEGVSEEEHKKLRVLRIRVEEGIKPQLVHVHDLEDKIRAMVEKDPALSLAKDEQKSGFMLGHGYVSKQEQLHAIESELKVNDSILSSVRQNMSSRDHTSADISSKVMAQIGQLEMRRLELTQFSGYSAERPEIVALNTRIEKLKKILSDQMAIEPGRSASLGQLGHELPEKNTRLKMQQETLTQELRREDKTFKKSLKLNFAFDALIRDFNTQVSILSDLHRELQRLRLGEYGPPSTVSILAPATLALTTAGISITKRTFFSFFIGLVFALSGLLIFDILFPILLCIDDLASLKIRNFGVFASGQRAVTQVANCLRSILQECGEKKSVTLALFPVTSGSGVLGIGYGAINKLVEEGTKIGVILLEGDRADADSRRFIDRFEGKLQRLSMDEAPSRLAGLVASLRESSEMVFLVVTDRSNLRIELFVARCVDDFFYLTELGLSDLRSLQRLKDSASERTTVGHFALVFNRLLGKTT